MELMAMLDKYAKDYPRRWNNFAYCRIDGIHIEQEKIVATIGFQHRKAWQNLGTILVDKSDLVGYIYELSKKMGISYDELPSRELVYYAGALKCGTTRVYRRGLHSAENIAEKDHGKCSDGEKENGLASEPEDLLFLSRLKESH